MTPGKPTKRRRWPWIVGGAVLALALLIALFDWNWFKPLVERQASAALGREVSIGSLHVRLGWVPRVTADRVVIANPPDWPGGGDFATIERLSVDVDAGAYLRSRSVVIPAIVADKPVVDAAQTADGRSNWVFGQPGAPAGPEPQIGAVQINGGRAHIVVPKLKADITLAVSTKDGGAGGPQLVADANGTYAGQPITGSFTGGALLNLRDAATPYPIDLALANGATKVTLVGTVQNPLSFAGANLQLTLGGPDMALLLPLTGIAIPRTPPYEVAGRLDWQAGSVRFTGFTGTVGKSDLAGDVSVDTKPARPVVTAELTSKLVELDDLAGFLGGTPGDASTPGQTPEQRREVVRAKAGARVLPDMPIDVPKLTVADVRIKYRAERIRGGKSQPLDHIVADLDITDGVVTLKPLKFGVGSGSIAATVALTPAGDAAQVQASIDFQRVPLDKLLTATGVARGAGTIAGKVVVNGTGSSLAQVLGSGDGEVKLYMGRGGNLSALLVDLSGLQFGNALLSALGVPDRSRIECLIVDMGLRRGVLSTRTVLLDTDADRVGIAGEISLRDESLALELKTESKHFSVGSLPASIQLAGTLKNPAIRPELGEVAGRAGAAVALGIVLTPLAALIPTIQLGVGDDKACTGLLPAARSRPRPPPQR